jgi:hypothetical protein
MVEAALLDDPASAKTSPESRRCVGVGAGARSAASDDAGLWGKFAEWVSSPPAGADADGGNVGAIADGPLTDPSGGSTISACA